jgi:putative transposase
MKHNTKYYILITKTRETAYKKAKYNTVALDPGVRTFETFYSPNGLVGKLGDKLNLRIRFLHERIDKLLSLKSKAGKRTKRNIKIRINKLRDKIKEIVRDQHWKISSFLCENFENIIIPQFGVKEMSKKDGRTIGKKTTREMLSLCHGSFLEKLQYKCSENQRNLYIVTEEYTTKTCGGCGEVNEVGSSKTYKCAKCNIKIDRDYNGARNIYLKALPGLDMTL